MRFGFLPLDLFEQGARGQSCIVRNPATIGPDSGRLEWNGMGRILLAGASSNDELL